MKKRVLFVCYANAIRSQMAEAFARAYGADVLIAASAGLSPAMTLMPYTRSVMREKNLLVDDHFPKGLESFSRVSFDLVVNLSGLPLPRPFNVPVLEWPIADPVGRAEADFRDVRDEIERRVMRLILELRTSRPN